MIKKLEKLVLFNQYEIMKAIFPDDADIYEQCQKTVEYGSNSDIEAMASMLEGTSESVKEEVYEILSMYRDLENSYRANNNSDDIPYKVKFRGFDRNEEIEHYFYCEYLIKYAGKYDEYCNCNLNSHFPTLQRYRKMLNNYKKIISNRTCLICDNLLSNEEIDAVVN